MPVTVTADAELSPRCQTCPQLASSVEKFAYRRHIVSKACPQASGTGTASMVTSQTAFTTTVVSNLCFLSEIWPGLKMSGFAALPSLLNWQIDLDQHAYFLLREALSSRVPSSLDGALQVINGFVPRFRSFKPTGQPVLDIP